MSADVHSDDHEILNDHNCPVKMQLCKLDYTHMIWKFALDI